MKLLNAWLSLLFCVLVSSTRLSGHPGPIAKPRHLHHSKRHVVTIRASKHDKDDVSDEFLHGIRRANHGGTLYLKRDEKYVIGKKLNLTFLNDVHVNVEGEILFTNDIDYWQANNFYYAFQKSVTFWVWGGKDISIYGAGTINGNGQAWYDGFAGNEILDPDNTFYRPILFTTDNATRLSVEGLTLLNSPCWTTFMVRSKDISFDKINIIARSTNASSLPKNTDGFDSLNVDGLSVTNTIVDIGDDCFSPKPNTTNIYVKNLWCNGTHGVSMGSIGQYPGVLDYISNAYIEDVVMLNGQNGARLKGWAGQNVGYGYISNITFKNFMINNTDKPIVLDQCYFNVDAETCKKYPSAVNMTDILFENFRGEASPKAKDVVASLSCSPSAVCSGIKFKNVQLTSASGEAGKTVCSNIQDDGSLPCAA